MLFLKTILFYITITLTFLNKAAAPAPIVEDPALEPRIELIKRWKAPPPICNVEGLSADKWIIINEGIPYLQKRAKDGKSCKAGPHACVRQSCSWNSAIQICNDGFEPISISCNTIAEYAADIVATCGKWESFSGKFLVKGQEFDTDHWNVVVRYDRC